MVHIIRRLRMKCIYLAQLLKDSLILDECQDIRQTPGGPHSSVIEYAASTLIAQLVYRVHSNNLTIT